MQTKNREKTAENKIKAFENAGVKVADKPSDVAALLAKAPFSLKDGVAQSALKKPRKLGVL